MPINSFDNYPMSWHPHLDRKQRSLYKSLAKQLQTDIKTGALKPGTKMPPQRELADFLDINLSTVTKAYKQCEMLGLLSATVGNGTFVSYDALTSPRLVPGSTIQPIIDMGATVPEPSGNDILMQVTRELVNETTAMNLFNYHPSEEKEWQLDAAVALMQYCGHLTKREHILLSNGGQNALSAVLGSLFQRGDRIAVDAHTYPGIKTAAMMFGIQLVPIPQNNDGMDIEALEFACKNDHIAGIYVIPASHNPTTITMTPAVRKEIACIVKKYHCLLIEDATYQLLNPFQDALSDYVPDKSIYIISLSKAIAPGLRLAYLSVPLAYKQTISDALYTLNVSVVPFMSELAARILVSGKFETIITCHKEETAKRNRIVDTYFPAEYCLGKETDIFRWLLLPDELAEQPFEQIALTAGVRVFGAVKFAVGKTKPANAVRLSICAPPNTDVLRQGLKILSELIK